MLSFSRHHFSTLAKKSITWNQLTKPIPFTKSIYPSLKRNPQFAQLTEQDLNYFQNTVGLSETEGYLSDLSLSSSTSSSSASSLLLPFNQDWQNKYRGESKLVLFPKTTDQVSQILKYCNARKLAVVPQGGNTGLVGGSVPVFDEIVVSLAKMNKIHSFNKASGALICDAGCILENLDKYLTQEDHIMPWDLGAKGSCHVGGNVATNAGGLRLLRYGSLHGSILGLEVVLADGRILDNLVSLRKDNTGYDLKQLFIGSEGTLGIITKVCVLAAPLPKSVNVVFMGCQSFEHAAAIYSLAKSHLGEILSACEFLDGKSLQTVLKNIPNTRNPLQSIYPFQVLIETSGSDSAHDEEKLMKFLTLLENEKLAISPTIAQGTSQILAFWKLRETIAESMKLDGYIWKYDISLPINKMYEVVDEMKIRLKTMSDDPKCYVVGYGHLGDGNLHLNVVSTTRDEKTKNAIEPFIYEWTGKHRGSISAEHGLGLMKANCIGYSKSQISIDIMRNLKNLLDPNGILNPYKTIPM